jgi:hypothetical protein
VNGTLPCRAAMITDRPLDTRGHRAVIMGLRSSRHQTDGARLWLPGCQNGNRQHEMSEGAKQTHDPDLGSSSADHNPACVNIACSPNSTFAGAVSPPAAPDAPDRP